MNKLLIGKINLSKIDKTKIFEGKKGKYIDIAVWFSEEPDQYGNNLSIQQSTKKDEPKIYLGEAKFFTPKEEPPKSNEKWNGKKEVKSMTDTKELEIPDLPF